MLVQSQMMDNEMICLWREAFKIFHFLPPENISIFCFRSEREKLGFIKLLPCKKCLHHL